MNANSKAILFSILIFFGTFLAISFLLRLVFNDSSNIISTGVTAFLAVILSPRRKIINKQSGNEVQLKWIFSKTVITIK